MSAELERLAASPSLVWPSDAAQTIERHLGGSDHESLALSVRLAGDMSVMNQQIASRLLDLARHAATPVLRADAILALGPALEQAVEVGLEDSFDGSFDSPALTPALFERVRTDLGAIYRDPSEPDCVRIACLCVSVEAPEPWHVDAARAAFQRPELDWKCAAVLSMGRLAGFEQELLGALGSTEPMLRIEAVRSVARRGLRAAGSRVLALARDPSQNPDLRGAAVEALAWICPPGSAELLESLARGGDAELRTTAVQALRDRRAFTDPPSAPNDHE